MSITRRARELVRFPGSGGAEHDATRPLSAAQLRRLAEPPSDLEPPDEARRLALRSMGLKLAGVAALVCGAYVAGWSSVEPARGTAAMPRPSREPVPIAIPDTLAAAAPSPEPAAAPATPPATVTVRRLSNEEFRELQARLATLGHDPGPVDGLFGPQTISAVKRYEVANGREPTGNIDLRLLEQLRREP